MIPEYVESVGRMAYIWGWPLVNNFNRAAAFAQLPEPGRIGGVLPAAPLGYISILSSIAITKLAGKGIPRRTRSR